MKKKMLIIDDKIDFRSLVTSFFSRKYDVVAAENGVDALGILQNGYMPDAIVSDLMMPELDGCGFVEQLKASGAFSHIPVIILSSIDTSKKRIELLKKGADDFINKPFNPEELAVKVAKLMDKQ